MTSNLPPGVSDSMIPGNTPEDLAWEKFHEQIDKDADTWSMNPDNVSTAWAMGIQYWRIMEDARKQGHDKGMTEAADILVEMGHPDVAALVRPGGGLRIRKAKP